MKQKIVLNGTNMSSVGLTRHNLYSAEAKKLSDLNADLATKQVIKLLTRQKKLRLTSTRKINWVTWRFGSMGQSRYRTYCGFSYMSPLIVQLSFPNKVSNRWLIASCFSYKKNIHSKTIIQNHCDESSHLLLRSIFAYFLWRNQNQPTCSVPGTSSSKAKNYQTNVLCTETNDSDPK